MIAPDYWDNWWLERDPALEFEAEALEKALAVWRRFADPVPRRSALTARVLKPFLTKMCIVERSAPGRYRIRLMGSTVAMLIGDMQGRPLEDCLAPHVLKRWTTALDTLFEEMCPLRILSCVAGHGRVFVRAEMLAAPLLDDGLQPTMAFGVAQFRAGAELFERTMPAPAFARL